MSFGKAFPQKYKASGEKALRRIRMNFRKAFPRQYKARGEKAAEFGSRRDADESIRQLAKGCERLTALFGPRFVPVFVPPWNRLSPQIARRLPEAGLVASSTFTQFHPRALPYLQTHIDMIKWKKDRRFIGWRSAALRFDYQLARRRTNAGEPLGILSHHLAQNGFGITPLSQLP